MIIVPGLPEDPSPEDRETARLAARMLLAIEECLGTIDDEEVRTQVPILLVQFVCANIAQGAVSGGRFRVEEIHRIRNTVLDGARRGWMSGIEASVRLIQNGAA